MNNPLKYIDPSGYYTEGDLNEDGEVNVLDMIYGQIHGGEDAADWVAGRLFGESGGGIWVRSPFDTGLYHFLPGGGPGGTNILRYVDLNPPPPKTLPYNPDRDTEDKFYPFGIFSEWYETNSFFHGLVEAGELFVGVVVDTASGVVLVYGCATFQPELVALGIGGLKVGTDLCRDVIYDVSDGQQGQNLEPAQILGWAWSLGFPIPTEFAMWGWNPIQQQFETKWQ